MSIVMLSNF
uniref:Uncharacterized protein n=1 Tax=Rhizophora mucronata TaxID=61149 RepID=A0A2P2PXH6_RHIMU